MSPDGGISFDDAHDVIARPLSKHACVTSTCAAAAQSHFHENEEVVILLASIKGLLICTNDSH